MKILYLHQYFVFPEDSGGTRSFDLANLWNSKGLEIEVVTTSAFIKSIPLKKGWNVINRDNITVHILKLDYDNKLPFLKRIFVFLQFIFFASFKVLRLKCDVLLATSTPLTIGIPALLKKWRHKTPFVFEVRDVWPEAVIAIGALNNKVLANVLYSLEKAIYRSASLIVTLSDDMKTSIVSRYPKVCENKAVVVIENISEIKRFKYSSNSDSQSNLIQNSIGCCPRFSILYAGTFGKVNGIGYVVDLAEEVLKIDKTIVFILMGDGVMKDSVSTYAKIKGVLNRNLYILKPVSKMELPNWYNAVDMGSSFVIPIKELWANSANKFFDTLAASKPILINYEGWQAKVIRDSNLGYVLPTVVSQEAVKEFVEYTYDEKLLKEQSLNAFKKASYSYSLDVASEKYLSLFQNIMRNYVSKVH